MMRDPRAPSPLSPDSDDAPEPSPRYREALERFVIFWGEMASNWGINRTMAQIHALLYASEDPLDTDTIMARLQISRGNASMNLRSLLNWNLVRKVRLPGSRKDYYTAEKDVWKITAQIIKERERREIKPVKQQLRECRDILAEGQECDALEPLDAQLCRRIDNLVQLMEVFEGFSRALLPFLEERNAPMIKEFIRFVEEFHGASSRGE
jgi:DNA-binding transcriptional regulator GbsR (MarR family)